MGLLTNIEKLKIIDEYNISELTELKDINILLCSNCYSLKSIPNIIGLHRWIILRRLYIITDIPDIEELKELDYSGCNWIYPNVETISKLIKLQRWFTKYSKFFSRFN